MTNDEIEDQKIHGRNVSKNYMARKEVGTMTIFLFRKDTYWLKSVIDGLSRL